MDLLEQLFPERPDYKDTDGDGITDRVAARLVVPGRLDWSPFWAEAAHLACRWAFETVRLDESLVRFTKPRGPRPRLVLRLRPEPTREGPPSPRVQVVRRSPVEVVATGETREALTSFLRFLAVSDGLNLPVLPGSWRRLEWVSGPDPQLKVWTGSRQKEPWLIHKISRERTGLLDPFSMPPVKERAAQAGSFPDVLDLSRPGGIFEPVADDPRRRALRLAVELPSERLSPAVGRALCLALCRVSLEATEIELPFVHAGPVRHGGVVLEIREDAGSPEAEVRAAEDDRRRLVLRGDGAALQNALLRWLPRTVREPGPGEESMMSLREAVHRVHAVRRAWAPPVTTSSDPLGVPEDAAMAHCVSFPASPRKQKATNFSSLLGRDGAEEPKGPGAPGMEIPAKSAAPLIRESRWNPEDVRMERLMGRVPPGRGPLRGTVFVSKPPEVRRRLKERLEKILAAKGYEPSLEVYNAYKPGLCWLLEKVMPALRDMARSDATRAEAVELSFAPFRGAQGAMEMRTRWLQEIYPGPDLLAQALGWDPARVHIRQDTRQETAYRVRAWNREGRVLLDEAFTPRWTSLSYYGRIPPSQTVHPTTAGVRLWNQDGMALDRSMPTDREVFWRIFGKRWLPALQRAMEARLKREDPERLRAFWEEIRIRVAVPESETLLGLDQERISPMEALHEDLYFTLLEFHKDFARRFVLPETVQLGQVMPVVAWKATGGRARARLTAKPLESCASTPEMIAFPVAQPLRAAEESPSFGQTLGDCLSVHGVPKPPFRGAEAPRLQKKTGLLSDEEGSSFSDTAPGACPETPKSATPGQTEACNSLEILDPRLRGDDGPSTEGSAAPFPRPEDPAGGPAVSRVRFGKRFWDVGISLPGPPTTTVAQNLSETLRNAGCEVVSTAAGEVVCRFPAPRAGRKTTREAEPEKLPPPTDRVLRAREVTGWVRKLASFPVMRAWKPARSFQGRSIRALEAFLPAGSGHVSMARLRLFKPTILFNARHHANEVSSTEAALLSAWRVAATDPGRALLKRVNLTWIPMENADGVAAFETLHPTAPGHKLHAARYNALGCEFYSDYFAERPRFPEALVKRRVWERWLPELILDGHGVPSHEWEQPFSGYAPGMFAEHWIPRSFLYVYLPFLDDPDDPRHGWVRRLGEIIRRRVGEDSDLSRRNREIRDRYRRYAENWEPDVFPPAGEGPVALLPPVPRVAHLNYCVQRPDVTRLEVVTEVVDEVAEGAWLDLCVRGHLVVLEALTEFLQAEGKKAIKTVTVSGRTVRFSWRRR
ncbi:Zinc carboxypeptidase [Desulfacinum infernum DSM 9756]|uniref:Zinc carboxypeptidase n=1 Tax=Desulfacinum infernum DSM 9756 TaxID=1121391 RepID=A0A1M4YHC8_9BACT|nr:M14 family metallopeptidase [Desulfacinum infernum]SHF05058.1 Zinc carboxypeptidase [Desulfacinum infernum DSM 9756]